jgi:hypothetical protein
MLAVLIRMQHHADCRTTRQRGEIQGDLARARMGSFDGKLITPEPPEPLYTVRRALWDSLGRILDKTYATWQMRRASSICYTPTVALGITLGWWNEHQSFFNALGSAMHTHHHPSPAVVIADDDANILALLGRLVRRWANEHDIITAPDGAAALAPL